MNSTSTTDGNPTTSPAPRAKIASATRWALAAGLHAAVMFGCFTAVAATEAPGSDAPDTRADLHPIGRIRTEARAVAITFDACATRTQSNGFDEAVLQVLEREQIPATIFVSGRWVETHPEAMTKLAREPNIEFGDHSYDHPHMSHLDARRIADEIDRTEAALHRYRKHSVAFRPPFGDWNQQVLEIVRSKGLPTVTWDVVSADPSAKTTTDGMIKTVVSKSRPGSIVIFHINGRGWKTAEALPVILRELRGRGFRFAQLSQLLETPPRQVAH